MTKEEFIEIMNAYQQPNRPTIEQINAALSQVAIMLNEYVKKEHEFQQYIQEMQENR